MKATASSTIYLAVIGPSTATDAILELAEAVGVEVAKAGAILLTGGMGTLSELALAAKLGRPIAGIQTWRAASNSEGLLIHKYTSAAEAVAAIVAAIKRGGSPVKRDHR